VRPPDEVLLADDRVGRALDDADEDRVRIPPDAELLARRPGGRARRADGDQRAFFCFRTYLAT